MHALRQEVLPPSGVEYATSLKLTPSTLEENPSATTRHESAARVLCNVVVARSNLLLVFEVREEPPPISTQADDERDRRVSGRNGILRPPTVTHLYLIREHRLHGIVTGLESVKILASSDDKLDRLLVSFKDAKVCIHILHISAFPHASETDCSSGMVRFGSRPYHSIDSYIRTSTSTRESNI
jgi:cleavage and polyadenylation specificity factor subunit 1